MDTVTVTPDFEKFDNARYQKIKTGESVMGTETTATGSYVEMEMSASGGSYSETKPHAYFSLLKEYYPNGNIRAKGAYFNVSSGGFRKGTWYEFDEKGKPVKQTDYDKDYPFTFENIVDFCKKQNIPLAEGPVKQSTGYHTSVLRNSTTGKPRWIIRWLKKDDLQEEVTLDGATGTVIQRRESNFINN